MQIQVAGVANQCQEKDTLSKTAVVIDVLRATSVITTALNHGACSVIPLPSIEKALELYENIGSETTLLAGERNTVKIEGFHLGNSPLEFSEEVVKNKNIILTTTNGTVAINAALSAKEILICCFLNIYSVADYLSKNINNLIIICSGTNGKFSLDDGLCAGMLIQLLQEHCEIDMDELGFLLQTFYSTNNQKLIDKLSHCKHVQTLTRRGFQKDVEYCLQTNIFKSIPELQDGKLVLKNIESH